MTDEQTAAAADQAEATSNGGETKSDDDIKPPKTYGRRAYNNLRAARRSLEAADWQRDEYSRHLVAEANVLALLDLADAIRGAKGPE